MVGGKKKSNQVQWVRESERGNNGGVWLKKKFNQVSKNPIKSNKSEYTTDRMF